MVLINIEGLSENELRYIAKQEDLDDWETLSREELIEGLEDLYEGDDEARDSHNGTPKHKFINTLTDVQSDNMLSLPGVESLPDTYNETCIHMVMKDFNWAYVFWSLSVQDLEYLEQGGASLLLRNVRKDENGVVQSTYDIDISFEDKDWTVEIPHLGFTYQVSLIAKLPNGDEAAICHSTKITTTNSWLATHPEELRNDDTFRKLFKSLILKGGRIVENRQIHDLISEMNMDEEA